MAGGDFSALRVNFLDNRSGLNGGAIHAEGTGSSVRVTGSLFRGNTAAARGGAVSLRETAHEIFFARTRFIDNDGGDGCGVALNRAEDAGFIDSLFQGACGGALISSDQGRQGFVFYNNTFLPLGDFAFRYRVRQADEPFANRFGGNLLVQEPLDAQDLCHAVAGPAGFIKQLNSLGDNIATEDSCGFGEDSDRIVSNGDELLVDRDRAKLEPDGAATDARVLDVTNTSADGSRCGIADAGGLGRPQDGDGDGEPACDIGGVERRRGPDLTAAQSGAYFDPARNGEGYFVEILGDGRAWVTFFGYTPEGGSPPVTETDPAWFTGIGREVGNSIVVPEFTATRRGAFGEAFDPERITVSEPGSLSLVFPGCASGRADPGHAYFRSNQLGLVDVPVYSDLFTRTVRLSRLADCGAIPAPAPSGRSGTFFDSARDGEGMVVQWLPDGRVVVIWYTFDPDGNQLWLLSESAQVSGDTVVADMVYPAGTTGFGPAFDPAEVDLQPWGTVRLEYRDCDNLELEYDSTVSGFGSGSYEYQRLTTPAGTQCNL